VLRPPVLPESDTIGDPRSAHNYAVHLGKFDLLHMIDAEL
jgi:hypothetical protein